MFHNSFKMRIYFYNFLANLSVMMMMEAPPAPGCRFTCSPVSSCKVGLSAGDSQDVKSSQDQNGLHEIFPSSYDLHTFCYFYPILENKNHYIFHLCERMKVFKLGNFSWRPVWRAVTGPCCPLEDFISKYFITTEILIETSAIQVNQIFGS